jgi:hypothetical protein
VSMTTSRLTASASSARPASTASAAAALQTMGLVLKTTGTTTCASTS